MLGKKKNKITINRPIMGTIEKIIKNINDATNLIMISLVITSNANITQK